MLSTAFKLYMRSSIRKAFSFAEGLMKLAGFPFAKFAYVLLLSTFLNETQVVFELCACCIARNGKTERKIFIVEPGNRVLRLCSTDWLGRS